MCAETFKGYYSCHTYAAILVRKLARSLHHRHLATRWSAKSNRFRQIPCPRFDANTHSDNIEVTVCDTRTGRCISLLTTSGDALFFVFLRIRIISPYAVQSWMPLEIRHSLWHRLKVTQATVHGVLAYSRSVRDDDGESGDSRLRSMRQREAARCSAIVERISSLCVKTKRIITITITITQEIIGYRAVPSALRRRKSPCAGWELIVEDFRARVSRNIRRTEVRGVRSNRAGSEDETLSMINGKETAGPCIECPCIVSIEQSKRAMPRNVGNPIGCPKKKKEEEEKKYIYIYGKIKRGKYSAPRSISLDKAGMKSRDIVDTRVLHFSCVYRETAKRRPP